MLTIKTQTLCAKHADAENQVNSRFTIITMITTTIMSIIMIKAMTLLMNTLMNMNMMVTNIPILMLIRRKK